MRCEQIRQLFDAYLDGDLSVSQATEFGAHRLHCADCRRALALMEVSGHIVASDRDEADLSAHFTDRLLACVDSGRSGWVQRVRGTLFLGGSLAAAAVIGLAFLGVFNRPGPGETRVLGEKEVNPHAVSAPAVPSVDLTRAPVDAAAEAAQQRGEQWLRGIRDNMDAVQQLDMTVLQWLQFLKESQDNSATGEPLPARDDPDFLKHSVPDESAEQAPEAGSDIEDL